MSNDPPPPGAAEWLQALFPAFHDPKVAAASVAALLVGALAFTAAFALGSDAALRVLGTIGASLIVVGSGWLVSGRIQGIHSALADLSGAVHWGALLTVAGVLFVGSWRVGLFFAGLE